MLRRLVAAVVLMSAFQAPVLAAYSSMYVFGDSLADSGNFWRLAGGVWPPSPPYAQQFSNGPVAPQYLAARLGVPLLPSSMGGTNYAVGGATTGALNYGYETRGALPLPSTLEMTGVQKQIEAFAASGTVFDRDSSLFMLWAGANDIFLALGTGGDPLGAASNAVSNLIGSVGALASIGVRNLLVPNMPNLGETPFGLALPEGDRLALSALSAGFNQALAAALGSVRTAILPSVPDFNLVEFDTAQLLHDVIEDPAKFGLLNATEPCFDPNDPTNLGNVIAGCPGFLFFDPVHPTTAAHQILGARFHAAVPEPGTLFLITIAMLSLALARVRRTQCRC
ncbi:SGNH/GDSL hydrolase family protein [Parazoarcus communis]|nr:SGNH/GDSL hydrolase family protein [Parazoarcus communis]